MKNTLASLLALGLLVAAPAIAPNVAFAEDDVLITAQNENEYLAKDLLIGAKVEDADGKIIGDIEDLVLNDFNRVEGVVMGTGGFLGIAEKKVGVKLSALNFIEKDGKTVVTIPGMTAEKLKAAEAFKRAKPKKSLLTRAMEKAKELTDKTTESTKEAYESAKEKAGPAYESAKEKAKEAYDATKEKAKEAYDATKEKAKEAYDASKEAVQDATEKAKDAAQPEPQAQPQQQ
ncbi:MAG: PRC-barrel domain-containing protein [Hyphomicrobiaceae bacterium]|nr:PRC-barrel domain-containing protein [Hyphomicrobiaceae bacterium]